VRSYERIPAFYISYANFKVKECVMKNVLKVKAIRRMAGIAVITAVIAFSMVACDEGGGPSGGGYNPSSGVLPAPSNIRATVSGTSVYITWNAVTGASWYNLYVSGSSSFPANNTSSGIWYSTTYTENNIPSGMYYFKIAAVNANGIEGAMSSVYSFTISGTTPTTPTTPNTSLDGTWGLSSGYRITISGSTGVINAIGSSDLMVDAASKGYIHVGDTVVRNLKSTGNLTWSGELLGITYEEDFLGNLDATGTGWRNTVFTLSSDGNTLSTSTSGFTTGSSSTWTRQ